MTLAAMGVVHFAPSLALCLILGGLAALASVGCASLCGELAPELHPPERAVVGLLYAFSPVGFQELVAGHLFWLAAYALLPLSILTTIRAVKRRDLRYWAATGIVIAFMSMQVQFFPIGLLLCALVLLATGARRHALGGFAIAASIAIVWNCGLLAQAPKAGAAALAQHQATVQWEIDQSTRPEDIATLGGYLGYDRSWMRPTGRITYELSCALIVALAVASIAIRPSTLKIGLWTIGLASAVYVEGWLGFERPLFDFWLRHSLTFTLFRELYHGMAVVAVVVYVLAACTLERVKRQLRWIALVVAAGSLAPFAVNRESAWVPAVQCQFVGCVFSAPEDDNLIAALPLDEPMQLGDGKGNGSDPARIDASHIAGMIPLYAYAALSELKRDRRARPALGDLGFQEIDVRSQLVTALPDSYEPHVGASFDSYKLRARQLRRSLKSGLKVYDARSLLSVERQAQQTALDSWIVDANVPPGRPIQLIPSIEHNDIRKVWVSGALWAWRRPELDRLLAVPVFTLSGSPYIFRTSDAGAVYALVSGEPVALDGREPELQMGTASPYKWLCWRGVSSTSRHALKVSGDAALAHLIAADDCRWHPIRSAVAQPGGFSMIASTARLPWRIEGSLPTFHGSQVRLVLRSSFDAGWHLFIGGKDLGPSSRVHGAFNGWSLDDVSQGKPFAVAYVPQRLAFILSALSLCALGAGIAVCMRSRAPRNGAAGG